MIQRSLLSLFLFGILTFSAVAQSAPQGFSYQSIVRNTSGTPLMNQTISLLFAIRNGSSNGPIVYYEKHTVSTNEFGLVNLVVGQGTPLQGDFPSINWGNGAKYLTVSIESAPNVFDELGSSQLLSVPYALYAQNGGISGGGADNWGSQTAFTNNTLTGNGLAGNPLGLAQQSAQTGQVLKWNGSTWAPSDDNVGTSNSGGTVTQINTGAGLTGGPITNSGTISLSNTAVTPGTYGSATEIPVLTVDAQGRVTSVFKTLVQPGAVGLTGGSGISVQTNGFNNFTIVNTGDPNPADDLTTASQSGGDVSGTFGNLQLNANVVTSTELQNGAVTAAKLASMNASNGQVLKWNGSAWAPAADASGNVSLTAGSGITISGTSPNLTITNSGDTNANDDLSTSSQAGGDVTGPFSNLQIKANAVTNAEIADNAVGASEIADNSVGTGELSNGAVTAAKLASMNAANGQVLKWNGSAWAPANDQGGSFDVLPGAGIDVNQSGSSYIVVNTGDTDASNDLTTSTVFGGDVSGPASNLQINAGAVINSDLAANSVGTNNLINGSVTGMKLNNMGALVGQVLKWNGASWIPANDVGGGNGDNWGTQTAVVGPALTGDGTAGSPINLAAQGAAIGQVLKWNGLAWLPANDQSGSGSGDSYTAGPGISITGSSPNFVINNTGDADHDPANEIQTLSIAGNQLSLSNGGGTVSLPSGSGGNNYTAGPGISITGTPPNLVINNTGDNDRDPSNELQTLTLTGTVLSLSTNNSSVDFGPLFSLGGTDEWLTNGNNISNANSGNVLIGTTTGTSGKLQVLNGNAAHEAARFTQTGGTKAAVYAEAGAGAGGFFSSNTGPAIITGTGNVGIGATVPAARLHITGNGESVRLQGNTPSITFVSTGGAGVGAFIREIAPNFQIGTSTDVQDIRIVPGGKTAIFAEATQGNVSIGSANEPAGRLHIFHDKRGMLLENINGGHNWEFWVDEGDGSLVLFNSVFGTGAAGTFATNGVYTPSDRRFKKDIMAMPTGILDKVMHLAPVTYRYKCEKDGAKPSIGFVAQEVDELFPELVSKRKPREGGDEMLSLNYAGFGVIAIKAIQEQQTQLNALKKENESLKVKTSDLEKRLEQLEALVKSGKE